MSDRTPEMRGRPRLRNTIPLSVAVLLTLGADSQHQTFSDLEELAPQLGPAAGLTPDEIEALIGTINPRTAVTDQRVYIRAFFDTYLRGRNDHLLDGPSPHYPDVTFEP